MTAAGSTLPSSFDPTSEPLAVVEIIRRIERGATQPIQCRLEDDQVYAVKGRSALAHGLLAELSAAVLGRQMGLPIPSFSLARIGRALLESAPDPEVRASLGTGLLFASLWQEPAEDVTMPLLPTLQPSLLATLYAFDHWIMNGDRALTEHGGNVNLLVALDDRRLIAIDHNLAFSPRYDARELGVHACRKAWMDATRNMLFIHGVNDAMGKARRMQESLIAALPEEWVEQEPAFPTSLRATLARMDSGTFWVELG